MATLKTLSVFALLSLSAFAAPVKKCDELAALPFGADVKIESAKLIAATANLREHCDIRGVIWPESKFALKLPTDWNTRFQMIGNGGWAGTIGNLDGAVRDGYAATSTDTGHDAMKEPGATFAYPGPNNPNAARKVIDHGYLAVHETALLAKKIIRAYYGADPRYSYWVGCSTGGRQGLMEAQRYPEDFDGYVVGAPVLFLSGLQMKAIWNYIAVGDGPGKIATEKLPALAKGVYDKCDAIDGLKDGLIENPLKCNFDPAKDLPQCSGNDARTGPAGSVVRAGFLEDSPDCFTAAQVAALKKVYDGPRDSKGKQLFPGMPVGGEAFATAAGPGGARQRSGWDGSLANSFGLANTFMQFMAFDPAPGASWDYHTYNFDADPQRMNAVGLRIDATIPDLTAVKMRGGKIIHYHGWADPGVSAKMSVNYYEAAMKTMGEKETKDFYRFFPVPGMFHCGGGPGCGNVDWLSAIVDWVENGKAPTMLIGGHVEGGKTTRTRPICMYPSEAIYKGNGSIDAAENFSCGVSR
jgi:feruloyl esterase